MVGRGISFIHAGPGCGTTWLMKQFSPWLPNLSCLQKVPMWVSRQGLALLNRRQILLPDPSRAVWWGPDKSRWSMVTQLGKVTCKGNTKCCALTCFSEGDRAFCFIDLFHPLLLPAVLGISCFDFVQEVPFQIRELEWVFSHL